MAAPTPSGTAMQGRQQHDQNRADPGAEEFRPEQRNREGKENEKLPGEAPNSVIDQLAQQSQQHQQRQQHHQTLEREETIERRRCDDRRRRLIILIDLSIAFFKDMAGDIKDQGHQ